MNREEKIDYDLGSGKLSECFPIYSKITCYTNKLPKIEIIKNKYYKGG